MKYFLRVYTSHDEAPPALLSKRCGGDAIPVLPIGKSNVPLTRKSSSHISASVLLRGAKAEKFAPDPANQMRNTMPGKKILMLTGEFTEEYEIYVFQQGMEAVGHTVQ